MLYLFPSIIQLGIAQFCSFPTVLKHTHLPVGSSIEFQVVVGLEALIKDGVTGLVSVVRVIPKLKDDSPSTSMISLTY
jgi:hypothetical protein